MHYSLGVFVVARYEPTAEEEEGITRAAHALIAISTLLAGDKFSRESADSPLESLHYGRPSTKDTGIGGNHPISAENGPNQL